MVLAIFTSIFVALILLTLMYFDLSNRALPNRWVAFYAVLSLPFLFQLNSGLSHFGVHALIALATFLVTLILYVLHWLGGGDVKLWTAVMFWAGPNLALSVVIITILSGGILGVFGWLAALRLRCNPNTFGRGVLRLISSDRGVPYGVALSISGLFVIYTYATALMRLN